MRALVWFGLDGAGSVFDDDGGAGLVLTRGPERAAVTPQPRALSVLGRAPSALVCGP
ncbi:MAG: hypothetical protein HXK04_06435 [Actinomyces graevenitzii]|nr:hypothetical protein [Actinomyces graevenitzii]